MTRIGAGVLSPYELGNCHSAAVTAKLTNR
jgi:hypothetical protein